jgi:hypothetical protein
MAWLATTELLEEFLMTTSLLLIGESLHNSLINNLIELIELGAD